MRDSVMNMDTPSQEGKRFFAITSLGRNRWYWVVWPSLFELQNAEQPPLHIAEGIEKEKEVAVEKALEAAGRYATWIAAKYAKSYYQNTKAGTTRMQDRQDGVESAHFPAMHEFLYRDHYDVLTRRRTSVPYRIVRRTEKYIYIEQQPYSPENMTGSWLDGEQPTYRLDRESLDHQGYAFIPSTVELTDQEEPVFFTSARDAGPGNQGPAGLQVLNLSWPCTVTEVQEAYRRLVKSAHPDGGGSHDKFLELQTAYEQALRICREL